MDKYEGIEATQRRALEYTEAAVEQLAGLPESDYKRALYSVADWVVDRDR